MRKILLVICIFFLYDNATYCQNNSLGSWNIINLKYNVNKKWSLFGEAEIRSLKFYNNFHYYEYKAGLSYTQSKNIEFTIAAGSYQTYNEKGNFVLPKNNSEFRIWPQVILLQSLGKLKIEQRYRAELRFTSYGYRNRFRYRLGLSYPLANERKGYSPFQVGLSNEIFFTNKEPYFERNRWLITFNYKPTLSTKLQIGYLSQFDYKINDETGHDFLEIGCFIELFRKKSTKNTTINNELKN